METKVSFTSGGAGMEGLPREKSYTVSPAAFCRRPYSKSYRMQEPVWHRASKY